MKTSSSSSSSTFSAGEKVCIVCTCFPDKQSVDDRDDFRIYIVDLNEDTSSGFSPRYPALRLDCYCVTAQAFCVLDSILYIFGSPMNAFPSPSFGWASVYTFDLSSLTSNEANLKLRESDLVKIQDMNDIKTLPVAIVTPDRKKIVVFSTLFKECCPHRSRDTCLDRCDFEIYDPVRKSWAKLAGIPNSWRNGNFHIRAYTFINDHVMLFHTTRDMSGMFTVDLSSPGQICEKVLLYPPGRRSLPSSYYIQVRDDFFLTADVACDEGHYFGFPDINGRNRGLITPLPHDATVSEFKFCVIQTYIQPSSSLAHLSVNIFWFDLDEYSKGKEQREPPRNSRPYTVLPATTTLKSFKFVLHEEMEDEFAFRPFGLFYMPNDKPACN